MPALFEPAPSLAAPRPPGTRTPQGNELTLRQLLSQQSGLRDYAEVSGPSDAAGLAAFTSGAELAENVSFINPPGLFWNYSNTNFTLAGRALEAATATPYRQSIHERVFAPLGMDRSFFLASEVITDGDFSNGYGVNDIRGEGAMQDLAPDAYENTWSRPAGFAFSNVLDWARLMQLLMAGDRSVVSDASHHELVSAQISTQSIYADVKSLGLGLGDAYGFGVGVSDGFFMDRHGEPETYYAMPCLSHGGDIPGFATTFVVFPSTGFGMVVFSNRDALRPVDSIRLAIESFGDLPPASAPPAGRAVDLARFPSYAGTYTDTQGASIHVSLDGDSLRIALPQLDAIGFSYEPRLEPTSLDNFELQVIVNGEPVPLEITFIRDDAGNYTWFRSRVVVAQRTSPSAAAP